MIRDPLYIGLQGSITDLASAILLEPKICDRIIAIWISGSTEWTCKFSY